MDNSHKPPIKNGTNQLFIAIPNLHIGIVVAMVFFKTYIGNIPKISWNLRKIAEIM